MDVLGHAVQLLSPYMGEERRYSWLTLAFHAEHRNVYEMIPQRGATADFVVNCVRSLLDQGCLGSRQAQSVLPETMRSATGDERQSEFQALSGEIDRPCRKAAATISSVAKPGRAEALPAATNPPEPAAMPIIHKPPPTMITRLPDTDARRDLQKIAGCDGSLTSSEVISHRHVRRGGQ